MSPRPSRTGFTLVELIVVISILAILAGVIVPRMADHVHSSRDARRIEDIKAIRNAVEQYFLDKGEYPKPNSNSSFGGWDVSHDGDFLQPLVQGGYLPETPEDPVNNSTHHYRYYVYGPGSYGCDGDADYYVLGIRNFESPAFAARNKGFFRCAERNWGEEFAYVTGGGVSSRQ